MRCGAVGGKGTWELRDYFLLRWWGGVGVGCIGEQEGRGRCGLTVEGELIHTSFTPYTIHWVWATSQKIDPWRHAPLGLSSWKAMLMG